MPLRLLVALGLLGVLPDVGWSQESPAESQPAPVEAPAEETAAAEPPSASVEELARRVRDSIVVVRVTGRGGGEQGLGTGFVVSADGLIATNLHVIGEARPIVVQLANGQRHEVTGVHASDSSLDLALIRIDAADLAPLPLGDSAALVDGQPVVAMGNPLGLEYSVVAGVVSGKREIEGREMVQLAIPIEPGNSGGPLLDMQGRVRGILTMKSLVTANLGFAVGIDALKPLLEKPNPIAIDRWLTIGAIDAREWQPLFGARWRQHAGKISVEGAGLGFGGRSLLLARETPPQRPFEMAAWVKLDDEAGAAGLVFSADGGDRHYGFYPSAGNLRLSRFDGPDVNSWNVLHNEPSAYYRPGEWNHLKVRLEEGKITCYVNDRRVIESTDAALADGQAGLAKFRTTKAEFKGFQVAAEIPPALPSPELTARIAALTADIAVAGPPPSDLVSGLLADAPAAGDALRDRAAHLERQAAQLRATAVAVHHERVLAELTQALSEDDESLDLFQAALLLAWLDNEGLDRAAYVQELERLAADAAATLPADADDPARLAALDKLLFEELGFHGSRGDYYNASNSYVNEVLDDREGIPITLSLVYMELARRLGVHVVGVGLPGHFVVRHEPAEGEPQLIDVFDGGQRLTREDAAELVLAMSGRELADEDMAASGKRAILYRMLHNLLGIVTRRQDAEATLRYLDALLIVSPDAGEERWFRAVLRYQTGRLEAARADAERLVELAPPGVDQQSVEQLLRAIGQGG